jgi:hypothetical protein
MRILGLGSARVARGRSRHSPQAEARAPFLPAEDIPGRTAATARVRWGSAFPGLGPAAPGAANRNAGLFIALHCGELVTFLRLGPSEGQKLLLQEAWRCRTTCALRCVP